MTSWSIGYITSKRAMVVPNKVALIYEDTPITYKMLDNRVNRVCQYFVNRGLKKGDRVAVLLKNCPEFIEIYFAAAKLGLVFVPLNFRLMGPELEYQIKNADCRVLIFHDLFWNVIDSIRAKINVETGELLSIRSGKRAEEVDLAWAGEYGAIMKRFPEREPKVNYLVNLDDPLCIMYTSGVTGRPKGAVLSHQQTFFKCFQLFLYADMRNEDVFLSQAPLFHSAGLFIVATPIFCHGATLVMRQDFRPEQFAMDIERYRATIIFAMTSMWRLVLSTKKLDQVDTRELRVVIGGGERTPGPMLEELVEKGIYMQPGFGQTESHFMTFLPKEDILRKKGSIGLPGFLTDVRIVDKQGKEIPAGEIGEIVARGPNVMSGYWKMPEETAQAIVDGVLYTGDLGYKDEEGYFYIVGRAKDMYRTGGENVYPAEIEGVLLDHPKIENIAIVGVPDEKWGETGKAFIIAKKGNTLSGEEIIEFLNGKIAKYKYPTHIEFVDELPMTASGKIKKVELMHPSRIK